MLLRPDTAKRFIDGYSSVLLEVLRQSGKARSGDVIRDLAVARRIEQKHPRRLDQAFLSLSVSGKPIAEDIASAIRSRRVLQWIFLRNTTRHAIFIDSGSEQAFAVLGLTGSIDRIVGGQSVTFKTSVLELDGHYVCDGIVEDVVFLGPGLRSQVNESLSRMKKTGRFHAKPAA